MQNAQAETTLIQDLVKGGNTARANAARMELVETLSKRIPERKIYLVFLLSLPVSVRCAAMCENPPLSNGKPLMNDILHVNDYISKANDTHVINIADILRQVDDALYLRYPKVFQDELKQVLRSCKTNPEEESKS